MCFEYTSIPVAAVTHATHGIDDSAFWISPPLAAVGIGEDVATFWGNYTELYSREFPGILLPPRGSFLSQPPWCNTRPPGPLPHPVSGVKPGLQDLSCCLLRNWWIQLHPVGNSLESCRKTPGIPLAHSPGIIPELEDHLPEFSLDSCRHPSPCLVKPGLLDHSFLATSVADQIRPI